MDDRELMKYLEATAKHVSNELIDIYSQKDHEHGLVFPRKRNGSIRVSEQEAKTLFLYRLLSERRFCLSVEVPTVETYRQKGLTDMSARVDITLIDGNKKRCAHLEFKAHNCTVENIRKDLEKLLREKSIGVWFHTLENADRRTMQSLIRKFRAALGSLSKHVDTCGSSFLIAICVLRRGSLQLKWLHFTGNVDKNQAVVDEAFGEESTSSGAWKIAQAVAGVAKARLDVPSVGKEPREGFFVLAPPIATDTLVHLSVRGGSYKIRNFYACGPNVSPPALTLPGYPRFDELRASGVILRWVPVSVEDSLHNLMKETAYWHRRILEVNSQESAAKMRRRMST